MMTAIWRTAAARCSWCQLVGDGHSKKTGEGDDDGEFEDHGAVGGRGLDGVVAPDLWDVIGDLPKIPQAVPQTRNDEKAL